MIKNYSKIGQPEILKERKLYSETRLAKLKDKLDSSIEVTEYPKLTIIAAGSLARYEASEYSDIDMFFFTSAEEIEEPRTKELRLFGKMIDIIEELKFPKFSRDCKYLNVISTKKMFDNLGSPSDDHENFFTARMLLLLESKCLYGEREYESLIDEVVKYYFKDIGKHEDDFRPIFLLNDICRYWKTILLNYESKRINDQKEDEKSDDKIRRRIQNYKLKYSRVITCFATICAIGSLKQPINEDRIKALILMTPKERLETIPQEISSTKELVNEILEFYSVFIEKTGLSIDFLKKEFEDKNNSDKLISEANEFGDMMFKLLEKIDEYRSSGIRLVRHLVI